ncbi:secretoglobin family 1D member 2-like [Artibeus jamaicensis]|uniref:secretoglobin family 1D member 2-like n=1 Tax=Artibeus jamaicensis TaxID=9417 RepID=UPI00235A5F29|nr:secretoglobin family 1D member 2-like [Artibeus jamaicensis]
MRLSLCVLLVTLALCCYEANAKVCPSFMSEFKSFLLDTEEIYNIHILKFTPPREAAEAAIKVKQCTDRLPIQDRKKVFSLVRQVKSKCNN